MRCSSPPSHERRLFSRAGISVDALLEDRGRLEHHHAARRDRHFLGGLEIAPDPLALLAHHERAKRRKLHRLAALEAIGDFFQDELDEGGRFGARQSYFLVDRLAQVCACDRLSRHRQPRLRRSTYGYRKENPGTAPRLSATRVDDSASTRDPLSPCRAASRTIGEP